MQISNFFVAFITPILLSRSSFAIYFLFGGCLLVTVLVGILYMPETRGADLETIGISFNARDLPVLQSLRRLIGRANRALKVRGPLVARAEVSGIELEPRT